MPREWNRELWIALAGPATSTLVAAACYAIVLAVPVSTPAVAFAFGGWKFSGTTGKFAGGYWYLQQFMREQSRTRVE